MRLTIPAGEVIAVVAYIRKQLTKSPREEWSTWASRRTAIQKIAYLALSPEERHELYEPYLYGPYSNAVQGAIIGLERNDFAEETAEQCPESWKKAVDQVLKNLEKFRVFRLQDLVLLSKIHFLILDSQTGPENALLIQEIQRKARILGWNEILSLPQEHLQKKIELAQNFH